MCTQWFLAYSQNYATITTINFKTFLSSPKETLRLLVTLYVNPPPTLVGPRQPQIFISLWIFLFWMFYINWIIRFIVFGDWLLSHCIMCSRFIYVVTYSSTSFYSQIMFPCKNIPHFVYLVITCCWTFEYFQMLAFWIMPAFMYKFMCRHIGSNGNSV